VRRSRGNEHIRARRKAKREKAKKLAEEAEKLAESLKESDPVDSGWEPEEEILSSYTFIPDPVPTPQPAKKKKGLWNWIKKHVRPDIGLNSFPDGEGPDWANDDLHEISGKLRQNLRVGLKITVRF
jgi:hypothetical protein